MAWIIDIKHWLDETQTQAAVPHLKNKVRQLTEIIAYATSVEAGLQPGSCPKCWRSPGRKPCEGVLEIDFESEDRIYWECPDCGDEGFISGWQGLIWDMTDDADMA